MKQIISQVEFLKQIHLFKGTARSIAERAQSWAKEDGAATPYRHRLMRSPLAQRVLRDLIYWSWDASLTLGEYVSDGQLAAMRLLEVLGDQSVADLCAWDVGHGGVSNFHSLNFDELSLVGRSLAEVVEGVIEYLLFDLAWPHTECTFDDITEEVRLVNAKLREKLHWLGEILEDLGSVMMPDGEVCAREDDMEPSICLDQFRIRRHEALH
jgi:hypothetical protein